MHLNMRYIYYIVVPGNTDKIKKIERSDFNEMSNNSKTSSSEQTQCS